MWASHQTYGIRNSGDGAQQPGGPDAHRSQSLGVKVKTVMFPVVEMSNANLITSWWETGDLKSRSFSCKNGLIHERRDYIFLN